MCYTLGVLPPTPRVGENTLLIGGGRHKTAALVITSLKSHIDCDGWVQYWLSHNYVINYVISSFWHKFKLVLVILSGSHQGTHFEDQTSIWQVGIETWIWKLAGPAKGFSEGAQGHDQTLPEARRVELNSSKQQETHNLTLIIHVRYDHQRQITPRSRMP